MIQGGEREVDDDEAWSLETGVRMDDRVPESSRPGLLVAASRYIVRQALAVSLLAYIAGVGLLLFLPALSKSTYIDENSLLPGSATPRFGAREATRAVHLAADFTRALTTGGTSSSVVQGWIQRHLSSTGADVHLEGQSVVAVTRARQGSGDEAMVLVTPFVEGGQVAPTSLTLSLGLTLFLLLHDTPWLSRDVIWVAAEGGEQAVGEWLHHYHHPSFTPTPFVRGGVLSTAMVFEIEGQWQGGALDALMLKAEGRDGQMPNLDVLVTVDHLAASVGGLPTLSPHPLFPSMLHQACGVGSGAHTPFRDYQVDAITLQAVSRGGGGGLLQSVERVGGVVEGFFRSANNLSEKLHHSYFLYLLPAPNRFVSIGVYVIPFLLLLLPLPLTLAALTSSSPTSTSAHPMGLVGVVGGEMMSAALRVSAVHVWAATLAAAPPLLARAVGDGWVAWVLWGMGGVASLYCLPQPRGGEGRVIGALTLVTTGLSLGALCCFNYSLALPAAMLLVPLAVANHSPSSPMPAMMMMMLRATILMLGVAGVEGLRRQGGVPHMYILCACLSSLVLCCSGKK